MLIEPKHLKLVDAHKAELGTVLITTSRSWSHLFSLGVRISGGAKFDGPAVLMLDGQFPFHFVKLSDDSDGNFFRSVPSDRLILDVGVAAQDSQQHSPGALFATPKGPLLAVKFLPPNAKPFTSGTSYLDLTTWELTSNDDISDQVRPWRLLVEPAKGEEKFVLCGDES